MTAVLVVLITVIAAGTALAVALKRWEIRTSCMSSRTSRPTAMETPRSRPALVVLTGGLLAGTLDITYACAYWGLKSAVPAHRILQSVASGLLGRESFQGGAGTAALGLVLHYFIAVSMAFTYYVVARRWSALWRRPVPCGATYGLLLYGIMNYVVVPLSAARPVSDDPLWTAMSVAAHVLLVGIPIALFDRHAVVLRLRGES